MPLASGRVPMQASSTSLGLERVPDFQFRVDERFPIREECRQPPGLDR